jgi:hypothetical protein
MDIHAKSSKAQACEIVHAGCVVVLLASAGILAGDLATRAAVAALPSGDAYAALLKQKNDPPAKIALLQEAERVVERFPGEAGTAPAWLVNALTDAIANANAGVACAATGVVERLRIVAALPVIEQLYAAEAAAAKPREGLKVSLLKAAGACGGGKVAANAKAVLQRGEATTAAANALLEIQIMCLRDCSDAVAAYAGVLRAKATEISARIAQLKEDEMLDPQYRTPTSLGDLLGAAETLQGLLTSQGCN